MKNFFNNNITLDYFLWIIMEGFLFWGAMLKPGGAPKIHRPLLVLIETISYISRAFSLGVRLAANFLYCLNFKASSITHFRVRLKIILWTISNYLCIYLGRFLPLFYLFYLFFICVYYYHYSIFIFGGVIFTACFVRFSPSSKNTLVFWGVLPMLIVTSPEGADFFIHVFDSIGDYSAFTELNIGGAISPISETLSSSHNQSSTPGVKILVGDSGSSSGHWTNILGEKVCWPSPDDLLCQSPSPDSGTYNGWKFLNTFDVPDNPETTPDSLLLDDKDKRLQNIRLKLLDGDPSLGAVSPVNSGCDLVPTPSINTIENFLAEKSETDSFVEGLQESSAGCNNQCDFRCVVL